MQPQSGTADVLGWSAAVGGDRTVLGETYLPVREDTEVYVWISCQSAALDVAQGLLPGLTPTFSDPTRGYVRLRDVLADPAGVETATSMWVIGTTDADRRPSGEGPWMRARVLAKEGVTLAEAGVQSLGYGASTVAFFGGVRPELVQGVEYFSPSGAMGRSMANPNYDPRVQPDGGGTLHGEPMQEVSTGQPAGEVQRLGSRAVYEELVNEVFARSEAGHPLPYDFTRPAGAPKLPAYFGVEVEYDHAEYAQHRNVADTLASRLHAQGLSIPGVQSPGSGARSGYGTDLSSGRVEIDITVAGEYVSAKWDPENPATWSALVKVMSVVRDVGGYAGNAGGHIHFSLDYHDRPELAVARLTTLVNLAKSFEDVLYQLGQNPHSPSHRGTLFAAPLRVTPSAGYTRRALGLPTSGPSGLSLHEFLREIGGNRNRVLNFESVKGRDDDHVEVRLADANLDPRVTQALVELWGAIIVYAKDHPGETFTVPELPLGTAAGQDRPEREVHYLLEDMRLTRHSFEDSRHFNRLVDLVFTDMRAKERALTLWLLTQPQENVREREEDAPEVEWEADWLPTET
ncbi:hypothetical protein, partial [Kitasatospora sp. NPDC002522]